MREQNPLTQIKRAICRFQKLKINQTGDKLKSHKILIEKEKSEYKNTYMELNYQMGHLSSLPIFSR